MRLVRAICGLLFACTLAGCDAQDELRPFVPEKEAAIGREYLEDIRLRKFEPVEAQFNRGFGTTVLRPAFEQMAALFPRGKPKSVKIVGSNTVTIGNRTTYNFTFEYEFAHAWLLGHIYFAKIDDRLVIERVDVLPLKDSVENLNAFSLQGKSALHYEFLALAGLLASFTIFTAIVCFRTPIPKRKWLWVIFVLFGFVSVSLNWTTGEISWNAITLELFSVGFFSQPYGPTIVQIAIPVGAAIFWLRRRTWTSQTAGPAKLPG